MLRYGAGKWRLIQKDTEIGVILDKRSNVDLKVITSVWNVAQSSACAMKTMVVVRYEGSNAYCKM